jgi:hypothetical protein
MVIQTLIVDAMAAHDKGEENFESTPTDSVVKK